MFGLFRKKDHKHYLSKGTKYLAAERYADARVEFEEALRACPAEAADDQQQIRNGLASAGNRLAELNLEEGDHAARGGDLEKAVDHFTLACDLAADDNLKATARARLRNQQQDAAAGAAAKKAAAETVTQETPARHSASGPVPQTAIYRAPQAPHKHSHSHGGGCGGCGGHGEEEEYVAPDHLADDERFHLLVQPLPGDLPERYLTMGDQFAEAYLLIQDGDDRAAFPILDRMLANAENDIVIYELALIMYRNGQFHECENLLNRSLQLNPSNPACYLGKVHLLADTGRFADAIATVNQMMELGIQADHGLLILGDLQQATGDDSAALETWSKALTMPHIARGAAERMLPVLDKQGRTADAKFLAKQYLKGCH